MRIKRKRRSFQQPKETLMIGKSQNVCCLGTDISDIKEIIIAIEINKIKQKKRLL